MKRVILFGAFMVALGGAANAANPKTETKATSETATSPTESTSGTKATFTYYVTGISGSNYTVIDGSNPDPGCNSNESPCKITANHQLTTGVAPKSDVDAQSNGYAIESRQDQL